LAHLCLLVSTPRVPRDRSERFFDRDTSLLRALSAREAEHVFARAGMDLRSDRGCPALSDCDRAVVSVCGRRSAPALANVGAFWYLRARVRLRRSLPVASETDKPCLL
jgi:hypothetical protein